MLMAVVAPIVEIPLPVALLAAYGSLVASYDWFSTVLAVVHQGNLLFASVRIDSERRAGEIRELDWLPVTDFLLP